MVYCPQSNNQELGSHDYKTLTEIESQEALLDTGCAQQWSREFYMHVLNQMDPQKQSVNNLC